MIIWFIKIILVGSIIMETSETLKTYDSIILLIMDNKFQKYGDPNMRKYEEIIGKL